MCVMNKSKPIICYIFRSPNNQALYLVYSEMKSIDCKVLNKNMEPECKVRTVQHLESNKSSKIRAVL